jgi:hypothetical protein
MSTDPLKASADALHIAQNLAPKLSGPQQVVAYLQIADGYARLAAIERRLTPWAPQQIRLDDDD